jgi:hypothetical protein
VSVVMLCFGVMCVGCDVVCSWCCCVLVVMLCVGGDVVCWR